MLIYGVADIHSKPARLTTIETVISTRQPDLLVVAGDMISYINPDPVLRRLNDLPVPVVAVRGNSDLKRIHKKADAFSNITFLHLNKMTLQSVGFVGISGAIPVPFHTRLAFRQEPIIAAVRSIIDRQTVLVTHPPPMGTLDGVLGRFPAGSKAIRELVVDCRPRVLLCGHIHEAAGTDRIGDTLVVNCSMANSVMGALVTVAPDQPVNVEMLRRK